MQLGEHHTSDVERRAAGIKKQFSIYDKKVLGEARKDWQPAGENNRGGRRESNCRRVSAQGIKFLYELHNDANSVI